MYSNIKYTRMILQEFFNIVFTKYIKVLIGQLTTVSFPLVADVIVKCILVGYKSFPTKHCFGIT